MARERGRGSREQLEVWKFGGASLADAEAVRNAVALIKAHRGPLVVVASALAGVTDLLLEGAKRSVGGDPEAAAKAAAQFLKRHRELAHALVPPGPARNRLLAQADVKAREYREIAHAMAALADLSARASDTLVARGERASSAVVAAALGAAGRRAERVDALDIVVTDGRHGQAAPTWPRPRAAHARRLLPLLKRGVVPVVPGFIGRAPDGAIATLGRGGSDLTATLLAARSAPRRVVLWKDVPGHPHRRPARRARRAGAAAAAPPRGGRAGLLRGQGAAPARADPARRRPHPGARAPVRRHDEARHRGVGPPHAAASTRCKALGHDPRPGAGHRRRQRHAGRARHRRAHLRRAARGAASRCR